MTADTRQNGAERATAVHPEQAQDAALRLIAAIMRQARRDAQGCAATLAWLISVEATFKPE